MRIRLFRPFQPPRSWMPLRCEIHRGPDRAASLGAPAPLFTEIKELYDASIHIPTNTYVYGLGGRDFFLTTPKKPYGPHQQKYEPEERYLGLRE